MIRSSLTILLAFTMLTFTLGACSFRDVKLKQRHFDTARTKTNFAKRECFLPPFKLVDVREYKGLGFIGDHQLLYPELEPWIKQTLSQGMKIDFQLAPILIELNHAYIDRYPSGHNFQLVMRARQKENDDASWRIYRGSKSSPTWWGNDGEFANYVKAAGLAAITALIEKEGRCEK